MTASARRIRFLPTIAFLAAAAMPATAFADITTGKPGTAGGDVVALGGGAYANGADGVKVSTDGWAATFGTVTGLSETLYVGSNGGNGGAGNAVARGGNGGDGNSVEIRFSGGTGFFLGLVIGGVDGVAGADNGGSGTTGGGSGGKGGASVVNFGAYNLTIGGGSGTILVNSRATLNFGSNGPALTTAGTISAGAVNLAGGKLNFVQTDGANFSTAIIGTGSVAQAGAGRTTLTGVNTYTGGTTVSSGTLALSGAGSLASSGDFALTGSGATFDISSASGARMIGALSGVSGSAVVLGANKLTFGDTDGTTFAGVISGAGATAKSGTGTTIFTGVNTYTGGTTISGGTLALSGSGALASAGAVNILAATFDISAASGDRTIGALSGNGGAVVALGSNKLVFGNATSTIFSGVISGAGAVVKSGTGTTTLERENTYTGGTTISSGTLALSGSGKLASTGDVALTGAGATLDFSAAPDTRHVIGALSGVAGSRVVTGSSQFGFGDADSTTFAGVISGGGLVYKTGAGTTTFSGVNVYTGTTVIMSGTLALSGAGSIESSKVMLIATDATFDISAADGARTIGSLGGGFDSRILLGSNSLSFAGGEFSGVISGEGGVTKYGSSSKIFFAANTYTGGTTIAVGALALSGAGDLASTGAVTIATGATFDISEASGDRTVGALSGDAGASVVLGANRLTLGDTTFATFAGVISGTGAITKSGAGTTTFAGVNTYTGGTAISGGTLALSGDGATATSGAVTIATGATFDISAASGDRTIGALSGEAGSAVVLGANRLVFGDATSTTFAGVISGSGAVVKTGVGTTTLSGANTYTGGTVVAGGALRIGDGTTAGAIAGDVKLASGGTLIFNNNGDEIFAGVISGDGIVVRAGTGTTTLTGVNTYTGGTVITGGNLIAGNASAFGTGPVGNTGGGAITIGGGTVTQDMQGTGAYVITGDTVLSGTKTGTGEVTVQSGNLDLGGTASSPTSLAFSQITILSSGTLSGSGSFGSLVNNGGIISPGHSPGTIVLAGDFTSAGGTFELEIAGTGAGQFDQVRYAGHATVNGTALNVSYLSGYAPQAGDRVAFLLDTDTTDHAAVAGTGFSGVTATLPVILKYELITDENGVALLFSYVGVQAFPNAHDGLAGFIDTVKLNGGALVALNAISPQAAAAVVTNASPIGFSSLDALVIDENRVTADWLRERARTDASGRTPEWTAFVETHGALTTWDGGTDTGTFDQNVFGGKAGFARTVAPGLTAGIALGYDRGAASLHDDGGRIDQDRGSATAYLAHDLGGSGFAYAGFGGGVSSFDTRRDTVLGHEESDTRGYDLSASAGIGYNLKIAGDFDSTPYASLVYTFAHTDSLNENATAFALDVDSRDTESLRVKLGDDIGWTLRTGAGKIRFALGVSFEHELLDDDTGIHAAFVNGTGAFDVRGETLSRDILGVGPTVAWSFSGNQSVAFGYQYEYGFSGTDSNRFDLAYTKRF